MQTNISLIDCTLRDGGYYNNWNFEFKFIKNYLTYISKTKIKNVEIGFLTIPYDKNKGTTANCDSKFFNKIKIPNNINCGIMINASDLLNNKLNKKKIIKILNLINIKKVKFIRFACHIHEVSKIRNYVKILKKKVLKFLLI